MFEADLTLTEKIIKKNFDEIDLNLNLFQDEDDEDLEEDEDDFLSEEENATQQLTPEEIKSDIESGLKESKPSEKLLKKFLNRINLVFKDFMDEAFNAIGTDGSLNADYFPPNLKKSWSSIITLNTKIIVKQFKKSNLSPFFFIFFINFFFQIKMKNLFKKSSETFLSTAKKPTKRSSRKSFCLNISTKTFSLIKQNSFTANLLSKSL